jgi:hypothetical protein
MKIRKIVEPVEQPVNPARTAALAHVPIFKAITNIAELVGMPARKANNAHPQYAVKPDGLIVMITA